MQTAEMMTQPTKAALTMMENAMETGAEILAFGAKRLEKDIAFQQYMQTAAPKDMTHLGMEFWQEWLDDYHEEAGRMAVRARQAGLPFF
jgi:hypothetical protein